jgi:predicted DNA-binding transcriptional regulator YafY
MSKRAQKTIDAYRLLCDRPYRAVQLQELLGVSERSTYRILQDLRACGLAMEVNKCYYSIQQPTPKP